MQKLTQCLEESSDPLFLIAEDGKTLWRNAAAQQVLSRFCPPMQACSHEISDILDRDVIKQLLKTTGVASYSIHLHDSQHNLNIRQSLTVIEVSPLGPVDLRFLVVMKSQVGASEMAELRERALAEVSHDLKNPLSAIFGYADTLIDTNSGAGLNQQQLLVLTRIRATANRAIDLVKNYQHLSDFYARQYVPPLQAVDLNQIINNVIECTWRDENSSPHLQVTLSTEPLPIFVERLHLDRLISNLLSNALKFCDSSGTISLQTARLKNKAQFKIHNTGSWLSDSEKDQIFERYYRTPSAANKPGTGIGLFIVKTIADAVGAEIEVQSSQETGTAFIIEFELGSHQAL